MKKNYIYTGIIVFVIFVLILFFVYWRGKKNAEPPKVKYLEGKEGIPKGWNAKTMVDNLHNNMKGVNDPLARDAAWIALAQLPTADMVIETYRVFNELYFKQGGTLTQWIKDEWILGWPSTAKNAALNRLSQLKLV